MASPAAMPISTRNTQFTSQIRYRAKDAAATATQGGYRKAPFTRFRAAEAIMGTMAARTPVMAAITQ